MSLDPADLIAIERLAELAFEEGKSEEGRLLRARKSDLDEKKDRYRRLFKRGDLETNVVEMARLAEALGRDVEARELLKLVTFKNPGDSSARDALSRLSELAKAQHTKSSEPLAKLFAGALPRLGSPASARPESTASSIRFDDDSAAAGFGEFVFDSGLSPNWQLPEVFCGGVALIDYDNDGFLDVFANQGGQFPPRHGERPSADRLFRNRGNGTFEDVSARAGISGMRGGYGHGVSVGDYDNDGRPDLFITRWRSYALYRNRGDGTFEDVTGRPGWAATATGQLRRRSPTSTTTATSTSTSATTASGMPSIPTICRDPVGTGRSLLAIPARSSRCPTTSSATTAAGSSM